MRLRRDICLGSLFGLPAWSKGARDTLQHQLALLKDHGYEGVVHWSDWEEIQAAGLSAIGMGRLTAPEQTLELAKVHQDNGLDFTTLHVGTGFETSDQMDVFAAAIIEASIQTGYALHVETHRGTMTQDIWRTLDLVSRFPELHLTLDFSHWYTGHEMTYGGEFIERLARLEPVFAQVRSFQLRVGDTGRIQRPVDPGADYFADHMTALRRCFEVLLSQTGLPAFLSLAPELLPASIPSEKNEIWLCYAEAKEVTDRFLDAVTLSDQADLEFTAAASDAASSPSDSR